MSDQVLSVLIINADHKMGLALTQALSRGGARVLASTARGAAGASAIRTAGGIPIYPQLDRAESVRAMIAAGKASVVVNLVAHPLALSPYAAPNYAKHLHSFNVVIAAIVQACRAAQVERFISLSLGCVYGDTEGAIVDEDSATQADHPLARAALRAEKLTLDAGADILRLGYVYGDDEASLALLDGVKRGRAFLPGPGKASFVHQDDVVSAIVALIHAERGREGRVYNVSDDQPTTHNAFLATIGQALGVGAPLKLPFQLIPDEQRSALLTQSFALSNSRAKAELGWKPTYASVSEGIERILLLQRAAAAPSTPTTAQKDLTIA
ncbi:MAG: NAD-dependent epimerase/dehydratase family protein [Anaerolineae bacterium]|nr:NAD-dependent epimerase/dehydratase family protein [Anaerolineae bacterium]MDW8171856.1 NAD-dependent epimerase/dehydratase family protein [Anaerolineae bacterium]